MKIAIASAAAGVMVVVFGGASIANAVDSGQQYTGCLKNGTLTNVAPGTTPSAKCLTGATQITWSAQGPQGIQGIQGIQGLQGIQGEQGPAGTVATSDVYLATEEGGSYNSFGTTYSIEKALPAGDYRLEGLFSARTRNSVYPTQVTCYLAKGDGPYTYAVVTVSLDKLSGASVIGADEQGQINSVIHSDGQTRTLMYCFLAYESTAAYNLSVIATPVGTAHIL